MAHPLRDWEHRDPWEHRREHIWGSESESSDEDPTAEECGELLTEYLWKLKWSNAIPANVMCIICHWAVRAGAKGGELDKIAFAPGKQSGMYSRHLDQISKANASSHQYELRIPGHDKYDVTRSVSLMPVMLAHEALGNEYLEHPELKDELQKMIAAKEVVPNYDTHPLVLQQGSPQEDPIFPLALYMDGVSHTKKDTMLGITIQNMVSGVRHTIAVLRKSRICKCGCLGWCSIHVIMVWLRWMFEVLAEGVHPSERHDKCEWFENDARCAALAGHPLGFKAVLCQIRGDWSEFSHTFGFPTWSDGRRPCIFCTSSKAELLNKLRHCNPLALPWPETSWASYDADCSACEVLVTINTVAERNAIRVALAYDKRRDGPRGRALMWALPQFNLDANDRLEPSRSLQDVAEFDSHSVPFTAVFWRRRTETSTRHRNVLFCGNDVLMITHLLFGIDTLHGLSLGVYKNWTVQGFWKLLDANIYMWPRHYTAFERDTLTVQRMKGELWQFYKHLRVISPAIAQGTAEVSDFVLSMLGTRGSPNLHAKASESDGLMMFVVHLLEKHYRVVDQGHLWLVAGHALVGFKETLRQNGPRPSTAAIQSMWAHFHRYVGASETLGLAEQPKLHQWCHMIRRTGWANQF